MRICTYWRELMAATARYEVDTCADDPAVLRDRLQVIAGDGRRVISVAWQTRRHVALGDPGTYASRSEYTIVSERQAGHSDLRPAPALKSEKWAVGVSVIGGQRDIAAVRPAPSH
jgi:hypothetical protein